MLGRLWSWALSWVRCEVPEPSDISLELLSVKCHREVKVTLHKWGSLLGGGSRVGT